MLRKALKPGMTVFTVLRHRSASGMSRSISVGLCQKGEFDNITWAVATVRGTHIDQKHGGVKVGGCGMDMGYSLVYDLGRHLWPLGFSCIGEDKRCPSNDHSNGDRNYKPHMHRDGGYALRHRWI